ncbi:hypothetical protein SAMN05443637_12423 [Pseudonocardia thermophila]|uniref:Nicotine adenine dinucleotide glycohydrolase (NADase) n=1 Tax=Pseudonocardia thermophila TaxID=1848 RepID=A0A1M6ZK61_PSETH|nr:hypothetical protein [Pseudonocardia thermophila]SHL30847.1 hypothetical protein SAMN05443637_12423 [Pseudonocardia thermophila]
MRLSLRIVTVLLAAAGVLAACGGPDPAPTGSAPSASPAADQPLPTAPLTPDPATGHLMLWPFADVAAAQAWQQAHRDGGSQPWHLDAEATALGFAQGYLGFAEIDQVTSTEGGDAEAWIGVGYTSPDSGRQVTVAVLHLVRVGTGEDAPWEVVGSRDEYLTVETPAYGAAATWPMTVGGMITGVDESLHVRVLSPAGPVGEFCCAPAGGEKSPWQVTVPRQAERGGDLTVVVWTGGHVADVERFAITGVRG